eukprot:4453688-Amphidinium_carterae.3
MERTHETDKGLNELALSASIPGGNSMLEQPQVQSHKQQVLGHLDLIKWQRSTVAFLPGRSSDFSEQKTCAC